MSWTKLTSGLFASHPTDIEGRIRKVIGLQQIVALMREPESEPAIVVTNVAGGSAVSTIIRRAKAIVSTIGGPNSHIVVVARDYSMPCIVGAESLNLDELPDGSRVRLCSNGDVEIWAEAGDSAAAAADMTLLRNIVFSGAVASADEIIGFDGDAAAAVATLAAAGLVENDGVIVPTPAGEAALEAWYEGDRQGLDEQARDALIDRFRPLDLEIKATASAWQAADARDDWDGRVSAIERLTRLHDATCKFFGENPQLPSRFATEYQQRLGHAHERVSDGDTVYFVGVDTDSYHTVWFTLHEDLLRLLQRQRDKE